MLTGCHLPIGSGVGAQDAGAEDLRVRSKLIQFLLIVCTFLGSVTSALVQSSTRARGTGAGIWCRLGYTVGWSWKASQSLGSFQSASSVLFPGVSKLVCVCFMSRGLVSYSLLVSPTGFQTS